MKRTLAMSMFICLVGGCGSKTLDIGGASGGGDSGGPGEPAPGTHSTVLLPHQGETMALVSEGSYLYWLKREDLTTSGAGWIRRCEKQDCPATQQTLASGPFGNAPLLIRNETLYFALQGSIVSCPISDCTAPTVIVAQGAWPLIVDDSHVYWATSSDNAFLSCPLTGCERATAAPATGIGGMLGYGADDDNLYWVNDSGLSKYSIKSAPKDGSALQNVLVSGLSKPASFVVDGGFVYWATLQSKGAIGRCPTSGCSGGAPEVLLDQQYYPQHLTVSDGVLFWLNETDPPDKLTAINRPAKLLGCVAANCAETVEVLDEARGGSLFDPIRSSGSRSQNMVADSEAVYWISDVTNVAPSGSNEIIDTSIRKWTRKPGK